MVREKVKTFAQLTASGKRPDGVPVHQIIILDEADSMTRMLSQLRRTMEKSGRSTKTCLSAIMFEDHRAHPGVQSQIQTPGQEIPDEEAGPHLRAGEGGRSVRMAWRPLSSPAGDLRKANQPAELRQAEGDVEIAKDDVYEIFWSKSQRNTWRVC